MSFLVKCAFCLALVFALLHWRPLPQAGADRRPAAGKSAAALAAQAEQAGAELWRAGAGSLARAAQEKCLAAPAACAAAARRAASGR